MVEPILLIGKSEYREMNSCNDRIRNRTQSSWHPILRLLHLTPFHTVDQNITNIYIWLPRMGSANLHYLPITWNEASRDFTGWRKHFDKYLSCTVLWRPTTLCIAIRDTWVHARDYSCHHSGPGIRDYVAGDFVSLGLLVDLSPVIAGLPPSLRWPRPPARSPVQFSPLPE